MMLELLREIVGRAASLERWAERIPTLDDYHKPKHSLGDALGRLWDATADVFVAIPWQWTVPVVFGVVVLCGAVARRFQAARYRREVLDLWAGASRGDHRGEVRHGDGLAAGSSLGPDKDGATSNG